MSNNVRSERKWQPSLLLKASIALHLGVLVVIAVWPQHWLKGLLTLMADHLYVIGIGFLPRSQGLGLNWSTLPETAKQRREIALTIDDGPDPQVTPQVLDILDEYGAKATFFCIAKQAETYPDLCREIVQRGHQVENHTYCHAHYFSLWLSPKKIRLEIETAQQVLTNITGVKPLFFRPTAGFRNLLLDRILFDLNLQLVSWTRRGFDTRQTDAKRVLNKLLNHLKAGDILLLHDGNAARTPAEIPVILEVLPSLLEGIKTAQLHPVTLTAALQITDN